MKWQFATTFKILPWEVDHVPYEVLHDFALWNSEHYDLQGSAMVVAEIRNSSGRYSHTFSADEILGRHIEKPEQSQAQQIAAMRQTAAMYKKYKKQTK